MSKPELEPQVLIGPGLGIVSKEAAANKFKIWKTIHLGMGFKNADGFRQLMKSRKMLISDRANDILGKSAFKVAAEKTRVNLVIPSVGDLGFKDGGKLKDIYACAQDWKLGLCPSEVGPQLRLCYSNQPKGEWLYVGMNPIANMFGDLEIFSVGRGSGGFWLDCSYGVSENIWEAHCRFVLTIPDGQHMR